MSSLQPEFTVPPEGFVAGGVGGSDNGQSYPFEMICSTVNNKSISSFQC